MLGEDFMAMTCRRPGYTMDSNISLVVPSTCARANRRLDSLDSVDRWTVGPLDSVGLVGLGVWTRKGLALRTPAANLSGTESRGGGPRCPGAEVDRRR